MAVRTKNINKSMSKPIIMTEEGNNNNYNNIKTITHSTSTTLPQTHHLPAASCTSSSLIVNMRVSIHLKRILRALTYMCFMNRIYLEM